MFSIQPIVDLLMALAMLMAPAHPHHPKALVIGGAGGTTTITYQTVPYNADRLKALEPGFAWHLGFAALDTEVALRSGEAEISPGRYSLDALRGEGADDWDLILEPDELTRARMVLRGAERRGEGVEDARAGLAAIQADLQERGVPERVILASVVREASHHEHLELVALCRGFTTTSRRSLEPAGGMEFTLWVDFGDLHREVSISEVFGG